MYDIIFYEDAQGNCQVEEFIAILDKKAVQSKDARIQLKQIIFQFDLLKKLGTRCPEEYVKHLQGEIWELRPGDNRILFFAWKGSNFVMLHQFRKTTMKTPKREIEKAERELQDWNSRQG